MDSGNRTQIHLIQQSNVLIFNDALKRQNIIAIRSAEFYILTSALQWDRTIILVWIAVSLSVPT